MTIRPWTIQWCWACAMVVLQSVAVHAVGAESSQPSLAVSVAADAAGRVYQTQLRQGQLWLLSSDDGGKHFSREVAVSPQQPKGGAVAEASPFVAIGGPDELFVSWTERLPNHQAGDLWFARSGDAGKHFDPPYLVLQHQDDIATRYAAMQATADGSITIAWLDARDKAANHASTGAAIYYAVSRDHGQHFSPEQKLAEHSCECCALAMASQADGTVALLWQHVFDNAERDQAMTEIRATGKPMVVRASYGHWKMAGCSSYGAAIAVGAGFGYHLAYYDGAGDKPGLRIARMDGEAWVTSPPRRFGDAQRNANFPALMSAGEQVWLAWQEHDSHGADIVAMTSDDGGRTWGNPVVMLHSLSKLDYPQWIQLQGQAILVLHTADKGLQLLPFAP